MLERVMRAQIAIGCMPSATTGRIICWKVEKPDGGSHRSVTENSSSMTSASTNAGIDMPIIANDITILSKTEYCLTAATIPIGTPMRTPSRTAMPESFSVLGK